jgi:hypothetical protein
MRMMKFFPALAGALFVLATASVAQAQSISITPRAGLFAQASNMQEGTLVAGEAMLRREAALALGAAVDVKLLPLLPAIRIAADFTSGSKISEEGVDGEILGSGLLGLSADVVFSPLPLPLVRPYVAAGVGYMRENYTPGTGYNGTMPENLSDYQLHAGAGVVLSLGKLGLDINVSDYLSKPEGAEGFRHMVFGTVGLRLNIF